MMDLVEESVIVFDQPIEILDEGDCSANYRVPDET
jgi:hypothetical protein